jgi:hypothetical protein
VGYLGRAELIMGGVSKKEFSVFEFPHVNIIAKVVRSSSA